MPSFLGVTSSACTDRDWVKIYHLLRISTEPSVTIITIYRRGRPCASGSDGNHWPPWWRDTCGLSNHVTLRRFTRTDREGRLFKEDERGWSATYPLDCPTNKQHISW